MEKGIIWTENVKFPEHNSTLLVDAGSYNAWIREACYVCEDEAITKALNATTVIETGEIPIGKFKFHVKSLPTEVKTFSLFWGNKIQRTALRIRQGTKPGSVSFSDTVAIPMLVESKPNGDDRIWMSLTPMEVFTLRAGIKRAQGRVLVGGLGMGWLTLRILEKKNVSHVTQIESNPDIAKFFGDPLVASFGSEKLTIVIDDVWEHLKKVGPDTYDTIILDIWPSYGRARNDPNFKQLKLMHPRVWGWGDVKVHRDDFN